MSDQFKEAIKILDYARTLLVNHEWIQGNWARDADGNTVDAGNKNAVCFCAEGAIMCAMYHLHDDHMHYYPQYLLAPGNEELNIATIPLWNDDRKRTKAEVLQAFDNAIVTWRSIA